MEPEKTCLVDKMYADILDAVSKEEREIGCASFLVETTRRLVQEVQRLRGAIITHHSQKADDWCYEDDDWLYEEAGLPPVDRRVGDPFKMLKNCIRFIENRCEGGGWSSYAELEEKIRDLQLALQGTCLCRFVDGKQEEECDFHRCQHSALLEKE